MKKNFLTILVLLITLVTSISNIVFATTNSNSACIIYSPNMNFAATISLGNLISQAESVYKNKGYTTTLLPDPVPITMFSNVISNNVQLYFCHGGYVNVDGKPYNFMLLDSKAALTTAPYNDYTIDGITYRSYCINNVSMSHAKLVTLAACYSAGNGSPEFNSIAAKMWVNGADNILGWYDVVSTPELIKWLKNYHTYLSLNHDIQDAVNYANTCETYDSDSNVQKCQLFVNNSTTLSTSDLQSITNTSNTIKETKLDFENSKVLKLSDAENIIQLHDSSFNENNYIKEEVEGLYIYNSNTGINENVSKYINYHLKIGDFITNSGYTVVLDQERNVKEINDNTIEESYSVLSTATSTEYFKIQENDTQNYLNKAKANITNKSSIVNEKITFHYDLKTNQKYANIILTFSDSSAKTYTYEM